MKNIGKAMDVSKFFDKKLTYAVVGASNNTKKFGFKIVDVLKENEYQVLPINPKEKEICGIVTNPSIENKELLKEIDVLCFVVPPKVTNSILKKVAKEIKKNEISIIFQPGSFNDDCIELAEENDITYTNEACLYRSVLKGKFY